VIKLEQNYRSPRQHPRRRQRADRQQPQRAWARTCGPTPAPASRCASIEAPSDLDEAAVAGRGGRRRCTARASPRGEIAVLYRSNAQSRVHGAALFNAGMPYRVYGGLRFFERAEIKHALAYLRAARATRTTTRAFLRVVNFPARGIGARSLEHAAGRRRAAGALPATARESAVRRAWRRGAGQPSSR
jgi:DNA helicase-2/ATP-dependent DNA helicase PcrA